MPRTTSTTDRAALDALADVPVTITVRRWFQRTYGNTYHTVRVWIGDAQPITSGRTYGYGDHWQHTVGELLGMDDPYEFHYRALRERGGTVHVDVIDVPRRRDLHSADDRADY